MKLISLIMLVILTSTSANADTLQFAASIQNEDLAEEAIFLLHCLADRSGSPWEFTGEASGDHWLELKEKGKIAEGKYHHGKDETAVQLKLGEAESVCARLVPGSPESLAPINPQNNLPDLFTQPASSKSSYSGYWPWALGAVAAVAAGYALLHSHGTHHGLTMN